MKKILSLILVFAVLTILLSSLTSCHGRSALPEFEMPADFDETKSYEITFWAKNDNNKYQQKIYRDAVANFESLYPNIKVNLKLFSDYGEIYRQVLTNTPTNTTPNVCITYPDHVATYNSGKNVILPLDGLMNNAHFGLGGDNLKFDSTKKSEIVKQFLDEGKIGGVQYAMPFMRSTEACYINADLVEALGYTVPDVLTWDFIWEVSEAATAKNADGTYVANGQDVLFPFIYKSTDNMMIQLLKQHGAEYSTENGDVLLFNDTAKDILYTVADHTKSGAFNIFAVVSYPGNYLNRGQCIFAIDSTAGATWMGTDAPNLDIKEEELVEFEMAVRPVPQVNTKKPQMISQGPSICVFNKEDPDEVVASWIFAQYLLTNDVQIEYSTTEGYVPVTTKAQNSEEYQNYLARAGEEHPENYYQKTKIDATKILLDNIENTFVTPVFNGSTSVRDAAGKLIEDTVRGIHRGKTVNSVFIKRLFNDITKLHKLDQIQPADGGTGGGTYYEVENMQPEAVVLLISLGAVWVGIGTYVVVRKVKEKKNS